MTSIVAGLNLGIAQSFINSSQGNANIGTNHAVNVATGNLFFSRQDGFINSTGPDLAATRVYNSKGEMGDNGHYYGVPRLINLSATGLAATLRFADGSTRDFDNDGKALRDKNAIDTLTKVGSKWHLDDGSSDRLWIFDDKGLLERVADNNEYDNEKDSESFSVTYSYDSQDRLTEISDGNQLIKITYSGNNIQSVTSQEGSTVLSYIAYQHDSRGRITQRHVDLSPNNKSVADNNRLTTTYTYDGSSDRIASITQNDGRTVSFTYGSSGRVSTVTEGTSTLTFNYNLQDGSRTYTRITDERGANTRYYFNSDQQITEISGSPINGQRPSTTYEYYDTGANTGKLHKSTDSDGVVTTYQYDLRGNTTYTYTSTGQSTRRTYNNDNQIVSEAVRYNNTQVATTYYFYESGNLRYVVGPSGEVTHHDYYTAGYGKGQIIYTLTYKTRLFGTPNISRVRTFVSQNGANADQYSRFFYDVRGQLTRHIEYAETTSRGNGTKAQASTRYTYDHAGRLLVTSRDGARATTNEFDAAGRLLWTENAEGARTNYAYLDGGTTTAITNASGLTTTTTINSAGQVIAQDSSAGNKDFGSESRTYNDRGLLSSVLDSDGGRSYRFYYDNGLLQAEISATGTATRYTYHNDGLLKEKRIHATKINTQGFFVNGKVAHTDISQWIPSNTNADRVSSFEYDSDNRLIKETSPLGAVTTHNYDKAGHRIFTQVSGDGEVRKQWTFYDRSGRVQGTVDGEGFVVSNVYNGSSKLWMSTRYATAVSTSAITAGNWYTVRPIKSDNDQTTRWYFNNLGQVIGELDAENYLTETAYNGYGDVQSVKRYAIKVTNPTSFSLAGLGRVVSSKDQTTSYTYNGLGLVATETHHNGLVIKNSYDSQGRLLKVTQEAGTKKRANVMQYDAAGRVIGTANGLAAINADLNNSNAITAAIDLEGNVVSYDEQGRAIKTVNAMGGITLSYFDLEGRLVASVDATGSITQNSFNQLGDITETRVFAKKLGLNLSDLNGGDISEIQATLANLKNNDLDTITTFRYNTAGQVRFATAGSVEKESRYNAFGELTRSFTNGGDRIDYWYDKRGQQTMTIVDPNGLNQWSQAKYDAFGRVYESIDAAGQKQKSQFDKLGRSIKSFDALNIGSSTTFDAFNRVVTTTDKAGDTVTYTYSSDGKTTTETFSDGSQITTTQNAFGDTISTVDASGNETTFDYNEKGQLVLTTDAKGVKTETTYDKNGNVDTTRTIEPGIGNAPDKTWGEITRTYFADGLLKNQTNALGHTESWTYDALGNKLTYTSAEGKVWQYRYDQDNRLTHEIAPSDTYYYWSGSSVQAATASSSVTIYEYNAKGQLEKETRELWKNGAKLAAANTTVATTTYTYNAKGERIKTEVSGVQLDLSKSAETLTTKELRDALGRAVTVENAEGVRIYQAFDARGQERFTVDGEGHLSEQQFDDAGRLVKTIRYANKVPSAASKGFAAYSEADLMAEANQIRSSQDRWVSYQYNALGQKIASRTSGGELTKWTYNANGQVDSESTLIGTNENDKAHFAHKHYHYTERGELAMEIISVSATQAYVTSYTYHANGEVAEKIEHAAPIALPGSEKTRPDLPAETTASIQAHGYDRITQTTLDTLGRVAITKERVIVQDRAGNTRVDWLTTKTDFTKTGQVKQTNIGGRITDYHYNAAGELVKTEAPSVDALSGQDFSSWLSNRGRDGLNAMAAKVKSQRLTTAMHRDAMGNVLREEQQGGGDKRITTHQYNSSGQLLKTTNAEGHSTVFILDKLGRTIEQRVAFKDFVQGNDNGVTRQAITRFVFDNNGQQLAERKVLDSNLNGGKAVADAVNASVYNAFGEVTASGWVAADLNVKSLTENHFSEYREFDSRGRLKAIHRPYTYAGSSRPLVETYDYGWNASGQATVSVTRPGAGTTLQVLDHLGQTIAEYSPSWTQDGETLSAEKTLVLDRWGNVLRIDASGDYDQLRTDYVYNTRGQKLERGEYTKADIWDTGRNKRYRAETFGYNQHGEVIWRAGGVGSAIDGMNFDVEHNYYNEAGQLVSVTNGAGDTTEYTLNAFGETLATQNGAGQWQFERRDNLGQVIETGQWASSGTSQPVMQFTSQQGFRYNALGQRTHIFRDAFWGEQHDIMLSVMRYDARGLNIETRTPSNNGTRVSRTAYNERGQRIFHDDNIANDRAETWEYDESGRLMASTNLGDERTDYRYDEFGRLQEIKQGPYHLTHKHYYENGALAWEVSGHGSNQPRSVTYRYGRNGVIRQQESAIFDSIDGMVMYERLLRTYGDENRLSSQDTLRQGDGIAEHLQVAFEYDKNGNRSRVQMGSDELAGDISPDITPPTATQVRFNLDDEYAVGEALNFRIPKSVFNSGGEPLFYRLKGEPTVIETPGIDIGGGNTVGGDVTIIPHPLDGLHVMEDGDDLVVRGPLFALLTPYRAKLELQGINRFGQMASVEIKFVHSDDVPEPEPPPGPGPSFSPVVETFSSNAFGDSLGNMSFFISPASRFNNPENEALTYTLSSPAGLPFQFDGNLLRWRNVNGGSDQFILTARNAAGDTASMTFNLRGRSIVIGPGPGPGPQPLPPTFGGLSNKESLALTSPFQLNAGKLTLNNTSVRLAENLTAPASSAAASQRPPIQKTYLYRYDGANRVLVSEGTAGPDGIGPWVWRKNFLTGERVEQGQFFYYNGAGQIVLQGDGSTLRRFEYNEQGLLTHTYRHKLDVEDIENLWEVNTQAVLASSVIDKSYLASGITDYQRPSARTDWLIESVTRYDIYGRVTRKEKWLEDVRGVGSGREYRLRLHEQQFLYHNAQGVMTSATHYEDENKNGRMEAATEKMQVTNYSYNLDGDVTSIVHTNVQDKHSKNTQAYEYYYRSRALVKRITTDYSGEAEKDAFVKPGKSEHTYDGVGNLLWVRDTTPSRAHSERTKQAYRYNHAGQLVYKKKMVGEGTNGYVTGSEDDDVLHYFFEGQQSLGTINQTGHVDWTITGRPDAQDAQGRSVLFTRPGDTLASVASRVFGDSSLWYLLAAENGLNSRGPTEVLTNATRLVLPATVPNKNNAETFTPFNQGAAIGNTAIAAPVFIPKGPSFLKILIVTIVTVLATMYGVGLMGGTGFLAGAVGGMMGNAAGQLASMALDMQDGFDFGRVLQAGVAGGVAQGLTEAGFGNSLGKTGGYMVRGGINYAVDVGLTQIFTDDDVSFSWAGFAAAAATAGITEQTGLDSVLGTKSLGRNIFNNAVGATMERLLNRGGEQDWKSIMARSLGQTVANTMVHAYKVEQVKSDLDELLYNEELFGTTRNTGSDSRLSLLAAAKRNDSPRQQNGKTVIYDEKGSVLPMIASFNKPGELDKWKRSGFRENAKDYSGTLTEKEKAYLKYFNLTPTTIDTMNEKDAKKIRQFYPDSSEESLVNWYNRARIITHSVISDPGYKEMLMLGYRTVRDLNPLHMAFERGWQIGSGEEMFTGENVNRFTSGAELILAIGIPWATQKAVNKFVIGGPGSVSSSPLKGAAQEPLTMPKGGWKSNIDGPRSMDEALDLVRSLKINEDINVNIDMDEEIVWKVVKDKFMPKNNDGSPVSAFYYNSFQNVPANKIIKFDDITTGAPGGKKIDRKFTVFVAESTLKSDEHIIHTFSHELFEIGMLRDEFIDSGWQMTAAKFNNHTAGQVGRNLHTQAHDFGDHWVRIYRNMLENSRGI